ncbi:homoserine kinase [Peribacillus sp. B-H-3]|jgi:homoserine kinase|uniref:homoserine kinase n=1 Tax=Peribacillus sp. B-H-3 TaxID=3400420 RepID=UPI003B017B59
MKEGEMFLIRVPASTANLGPGFDSIGLALGLYLEIKGCLSDKWEVIPMNEELSVFPADESNYIVSVAIKTARHYGRELPPCKLFIQSEIPLARGLGSSASAIVAGIELANIVCGLELPLHEKNRHASILEGHPDNAGASVYGGLVAGWHTEERTDIISFPVVGIKVVAVIPDYELLTEDSRNVLPNTLSFKDAVSASAAANVLLGAILAKKWEVAGAMMKRDRFHQPCRSHLVPHMELIEKEAAKAGAIGTALSGAGPTVLCLVQDEQAKSIQEILIKEFPDFFIKIIEIVNEGSQTSILTEGKGQMYHA